VLYGGLAEVDVIVIGVLGRQAVTINYTQPWHLGERSRVAGQVFEEGLLAEEDGSVAFVGCVALLDTKHAAVLNIVGALGSEVTFLEKSHTEVDAVPGEVALVYARLVSGNFVSFGVVLVSF
jgi:hypothetical protein